MSLLTGSACAPLISPVPPRHHRAPLCSFLAASPSPLNWQIGWQDGRQKDRRRARFEAGREHREHQECHCRILPDSLFIMLSLSFSSSPSICRAPFITPNLCNCLCSLAYDVSSSRCLPRRSLLCFFFCLYSTPAVAVCAVFSCLKKEKTKLELKPADVSAFACN